LTKFLIQDIISYKNEKGILTDLTKGESRKEKIMSQKVYEIVTQKVLESLENGVVPWHKPWKSLYNVRMPHNLVSKKGYRGINVFLLAFADYDSPYWLTFNQCKKLGGKVKKGEKSRLVVFWKIYDKEVENSDGENETQKRYVLRYYNVFNTEQCEDLDLSKVENDVNQIEFNPISECETIVANMPHCPTIKTGSNASYNRGSDVVTMPKKESFSSEEEYYATLFHELAHSTAHLGRLDRAKEDDNTYSKEELVAEMTSAMLCGMAGIENKVIDNSAAYLKFWSQAFKDNVKIVVEAAQKAQKAADYILGVNNNS
jgi:antirestriction protein ArdC